MAPVSQCWLAYGTWSKTYSDTFIYKTLKWFLKRFSGNSIHWEKDCIETLPVVWFAFGKRVGTALVRDIYRYEETETNAPLVGMDGDVQIDRLLLENISKT